MNIVDETLVGMIRRWPTLRQTRNDALYDLCSKSPEYRDEIYWDGNGDIVFAKDGGEFHQSLEKKPEEEESIIRKASEIVNSTPGSVTRRVAEQMLASDLLFYRREKAKKDFTRDNADLLVQSCDHKFGTTMPSGDAFRFLETIPENANPLWIAAFVDLANDLLTMKYKASRFEGMASDYADRYHSNLDNAKKAAQAFLIRAKGSDTEKRDLAKKKLETEIAALAKRAAEAGLTLDATLA